MTASTYLPSDNYHAMLDTLENIARNFDPTAPDDLRTRLIMAVGEVSDIWPDSCRAEQGQGKDDKNS
ncbi:hypothetical protein Q1M63_24510 [Sinorhizobium meliloti]|nr:hypothetical protein LZK74_23005 [Sinorhizobium meliloti]WKL27184.1 hypothetical protein Q1M63_24510 [Sinorhizobium meliloti]WKL32650.1 hypothetical protein Q1M65_22140 [Sinorhizobium meliloti]WKL38416.1 hypothetical protein Q1M62_21730 [Sinorhizobium meliloti]